MAKPPPTHRSATKHHAYITQISRWESASHPQFTDVARERIRGTLHRAVVSVPAHCNRRAPGRGP